MTNKPIKANQPNQAELTHIVDVVLHDMGNPHPKESKQWLRAFLGAAMLANDGGSK